MTWNKFLWEIDNGLIVFEQAMSINSPLLIKLIILFYKESVTSQEVPIPIS